MNKVSIHMKSGKTFTLICKEFSVSLNSNVKTMEYDGAVGCTLFTCNLNEIEAVTVKKIRWYHWWLWLY